MYVRTSMLFFIYVSQGLHYNSILLKIKVQIYTTFYGVINLYCTKVNRITKANDEYLLFVIDWDF